MMWVLLDGHDTESQPHIVSLFLHWWEPNSFSSLIFLFLWYFYDISILLTILCIFVTIYVLKYKTFIMGSRAPAIPKMYMCGPKNWLLTSFLCSILILQEVHTVAANLRRCIYSYLVWNSWSLIVPTASQWLCPCLWTNNMQLYFEIFCQSIFPNVFFPRMWAWRTGNNSKK